MYDAKGLLEELERSGQKVVYDAILNRLNNDRSNGSREPSSKMAQQEQDTTSENERNWSARLAGSSGMSSPIPAVARVQKRRRDITETSSLPNK